MSLPTSREETATSANPVKSAVINAIQDAIIGGKHAEIEIGIAACAFVGSGIAALGAVQLNFSGAATVFAPITAPVGDRITTIKWGYVVGASATLTWSLRRRLVDGSAAEETITPVSGSTSDNTAGGFESSTVTYNHQIAAGYVYVVYFSMSGTGNSNLFGASVKRDRL